jgi:hypothetical protein
MSHEIKHGNSTSHCGFERRDIGIAGVLYFLAGLAVAGILVHFVVTGVYSYLEKRNEARQAPVSPLVTNAPADTRHLSADYKDYLKQVFPSPQLEIDERNQLDSIRSDEAQKLATYDWIDQNAGTVRIPIDRAMDLIAQRGLPVRGQATAAAPEAPAASLASGKKTKGTKAGKKK